MTNETTEPASSDGRRSFHDLFDAESVALIGASTDPETITGRPQYFLEKHGYEGDVYPINPKYDSIRGLTCYDSVLDVPDDVDVALILLSAPHVPDVLRECGEKGIQYNLVIGSGFGETGEAGEALEDELIEVAAEYDVRVVGPNTLGVLGSDRNLALSFSSMLDEQDELVPGGEVGFVSQSGSFAGMLFQITQRAGIGTRYWATTGNEIDVDALELMSFMLEDPSVSMIVGYIESLADGERLADVAATAREREVPLLLMKVGQSDRGQEAVSSHTGKMAGDYAVYESVFEEYGIVEIDDVTSLTDVMATVSTLDTVPRRDDRWAVLTPSGGAGALIADAIDREGMELATFEDETTDVLSEIVPEYGSVMNPVDTTANVISEYALYEDAFTTLLEDENVDVLLLQFANTGPKQAKAYEDLIKREAEATDKIVIAVFTGGKPSDEIVESYRSSGIPTFTDPVRAVRTIRLLGRFGSAIDSDSASTPALEEASGSVDVPADPGRWNWEHAASLLDAYGISHADGRIVDSTEDAVSVADEVGYPVVMKASAPDLEHKTEAGGIHLGVSSVEEVTETVGELRDSVRAYDPSIDLDGVLVQETVDDGHEVIIGITRTDLGPVMMFGTGGTLVEVLDDVAYRTLPITPEKAEALLEETAAGDILAGHRGQEYATDALIDLMVNASRLYEDYDLDELDLNPVKVRADDAVVVDFLAK
ncbi:acetate--CoA ligase family protein [Natrarchaeobius oligotrophus]|uniref:acetate--CoA ligase (ADP-forming) n=1 Tax=Natrarchaeobius chitinivorans TaxID=1679083 RepID=A0A3N6NRD4_NATCH|nr:acetate--CoA ligase family protein [Natrarchaeobius chitinivorans]RQH02583.1 CoA-binding protein [Natrarchaeobius chitinivorans]